MRKKPGLGKAIAAILASVLIASQAQAQLGGLFGSRSSTTETTEACDTAGESAGRSVLGGIIGGLAGRASSSLGGIATYIPSAEFSDVLATSIACRLDEDEQRKAAEATEEVTRSGEVGDSVEWTSETRENVRGRSTVTARNDRGRGRSCMDVTDVIIVEGEETRVTKQMCRGPGQSRYTLVA